jgi:hypothetical protein
MTLLQSFTDKVNNSALSFFTDFIGDVKPFGISKTNNAIGTPTDVYSNSNNDELGTVTCTLATGTSAGLFQRIGIYQTADQAGGAITRAWDIRNGEYEIESRLKTSVHPSAACIVTCGYNLNQNTAVQIGAYFYHLNTQTTWRAAVSVGSAIIREIDTGLSVASYQTLRVLSTKAATQFEFFANGRRVLKWVGGDIALEAAAGTYSMPNIEIRDRVSGGGGRNNSFVADYMYTAERFVR